MLISAKHYRHQSFKTKQNKIYNTTTAFQLCWKYFNIATIKCVIFFLTSYVLGLIKKTKLN